MITFRCRDRPLFKNEENTHKKEDIEQYGIE